MAAAAVVMVAAASVEETFTAAASVVAVFEVEAFAVPLTVVVFAAVAFAVALTVMVFATMVLAVIGSAAETSTIGPSSLAILGIRSFIIPTLTTVLSYGYYPYGYGYDSYDEPVYQGSAGYAGSVIGEVQLRLGRGGYYHGAIDGMRGSETRGQSAIMSRLTPCHKMQDRPKTAHNDGVELRTHSLDDRKITVK